MHRLLSKPVVWLSMTKESVKKASVFLFAVRNLLTMKKMSCWTTSIVVFSFTPRCDGPTLSENSFLNCRGPFWTVLGWTWSNCTVTFNGNTALDQVCRLVGQRPRHTISHGCWRSKHCFENVQLAWSQKAMWHPNHTDTNFWGIDLFNTWDVAGDT